MFIKQESRINILFYCFLLLIISLSICGWKPFWGKESAKEDTSKKENILPKEEKTTIPNVPSEVDLEKKKLQEKQEELNNTEWEIEVLPSSGTESALWNNDILRFKEGEIISEKFKAEGYPTSRYTVRIKADKGCWETMQSKEDSKTIIFWRGDWDKDKMKGMFSIQKESGNVESYSFQGINKKNIQ